MPNNIVLPVNYANLLDEVYRKASVSADLISDPATVQAGASVKEFKYMHVTTGGLGDYSRSGGYTSAGVNITWKTAEANYDRGAILEVDAVDNQEVFDRAFALAGLTLMRDKVAPEADAFTFATLAGLSGISKATAATYANGEAYLAALLAATSKMDDDEVPEEGRILYTTTTLDNAIMALDTTKSREILGRFARKVRVPQGRFYTAIDMLDGSSEGETAGHFVKATGGKDINFMIVHPTAVIKHDKHIASDVIPPAMHPTKDAHTSKYRKYGIVAGYENKRAGIYLSHKA